MAYENKTGYPSVTEILSPWIDTTWFKPEHSERGSAVHAACSAHVQGMYVVPLKDEWAGYFDSFKRWCDIASPDVALVEKRLVDKALGYCGQPDIGCRINGKKGLGIVDVKTGLSHQKIWRLQVAGYRHLAEVAGLDTSWGGSLRLRPDGKMPVFDFTPADQALDFNYFLSAINMFKFVGG